MSAMDALKESGCRTVEIKAIRDGNEIAFTAAVDSTYKLGVMPRSLNYTPVVLEYGFFESFPAGVRYGCNVLKGYVSDFKYVFSSEGAKSVGMFGTIGSMFPSVWDWHKFWLMTAFLSIVLAFMNILPIPALDGGHVLFLLAEVVTGRKPSDKFLEYAQMTGMILLLGLFLLAAYNDITRFLF
jgi:regulator of sigma E protease